MTSEEMKYGIGESREMKKWAHLSVDGEMGHEDGLVCTGCSSVVYDLIYFPKDWDSTEAEALARALTSNSLFMESRDPYTWPFCAECKEGLSTE